MLERKPGSEQIPKGHIIDVYTTENIVGLGDDCHIQDALALLRQGIWELRDIDGLESTSFEQAKYNIEKRITPDTAKDPTAFIDFWEKQKANNRAPFLLVDWNIKDGIVGVTEGREYTYAGTGEKAIFINWVVVRNCGSNDDDEYSYRGREVANRLYEKVEDIGKAHDVKLLIAGVNSQNPRSVIFHKKRGFSNEQFAGELSPEGKQLPHSTENGAFIPAFPVSGLDSQNRQLSGNIDFYTKHL